MAAPVMPRLPATTSTLPKVPLWLSAGRGGSTGKSVTRSIDPSPRFGGRLRLSGPYARSAASGPPKRSLPLVRDALRLAHHPQQVPAQDFQNILARVAAVEQLLGDDRVARHVL